MGTYLDWNATTPPHPEVLAAMLAAGNEAWANPSSIHGQGRRARAVVEDAREAVAALAGADARDVVFTSGGTEANNLAIRSAFTVTDDMRWLVTSRLEHPSVTRVAEALEAEGRARVRWVSVTRAGAIDLDDLKRALDDAGDRVGLVTAQAVNHETGIVQPLDAIAAIVRAHEHAGRARLHVDAIQAWGKIDLGVSRAEGDASCALEGRRPPWDTVSLAGHKLRGPKGIGALVARPRLRLSPVLLGGAQEKGLRPGTTDPMLAAGLGAAARRAQTGPSRYVNVAALRDALESALLALPMPQDRAPKVVGDPAVRVPHVSNLVWPGWIGAELVAALDLEGLCVSSGAACSAGTVEPSPVLLAMLGPKDAASGVRVSLGEDTTMDDVRAAIEAFRRVVQRDASSRA